MKFANRTFQLIKGVGPQRERELWAQNLETWDDFERASKRGVVLGERLDRELREAIAQARRALAAGSLSQLAALVPPREHWRLYGHFPDEAAFFDIEADGDDEPTVVGVMDRQGVATFRRGHSLAQLPERLAQSRLWVTFNGSVYDVPALKKHFATFPEPVVHIDLRFLIRHAKLRGGLKGVEDAIGVGRPPHLRGVKGLDAIRLWREWNATRDVTALRLLTEYNLYDAINLRSVLEWTSWRVAERHAWAVTRQPIFERGEVLYDVSRLLLALRLSGRYSRLMELDHLTVPVRDRRAAAQRLAEILDVPWEPQAAAGPFTAVHVSPRLALDFDEVAPDAEIPVLHYALRVTDAEFDGLLERLQKLGVAYRSTPAGPDDFRINTWFGGRGVYWREPGGHAWEALTVSYAHR